MFETGNQLKGYIQREVKEHNISSNYGYNYYFTRMFLQKLYNKEKMELVLKGSYSQFSRLGNLARPLTDIDIVTFGKVTEAKEHIDNILQSDGDIKFKVINQFTTTNATLNYKILCDFDGKTGRISIDLKREEVLDFSPVQMPNFFSKDSSFQTQSISIEEHLASKLYVVLLHLKLYGELSRDFRRFKDFFDIHTILGSATIDKMAVMEILQRKIRQDEFLRDYELRGALFKPEFVKDNKQEWEKDKNKYQFLTNTSFEDAVEITNEFIAKKAK